MAASLVSTRHGGVLGKMLDVFVCVSWFLLGGYSLWLLTRAKKPQQLSLDELVLLWKIHKQQARCNTPLSRMKPIMDPHSKEFSGFRCECGYQYVSKRPIVQRHALDNNMFAAMTAGNGEQSSLPKT